MLEPIADSAALAWPLALTLRLGRGRRPGAREPPARAAQPRAARAAPAAAGADAAGRRAGARRRGQLELALEALADLDRAVNGGRPSRRPADGRRARARRGRGRRAGAAPAALAGGGSSFAGARTASRVVCEPAAIARALDNLIANALEHGAGRSGSRGRVAAGRLRLLVSDGVRRGRRPRRRRRRGAAARADRPRRGAATRGAGHGLRVVADVAAEHGGRFAACRHDAGACAVLELPLADG